MADCSYVTTGRDILRNCSLCIQNTSNFKLEEPRFPKKILSDLVRKDVTEFNDKFYHFQYATQETFKGPFKNYSVLKLRFFINKYSFLMYCKNVSHQYYATNEDTKPHILLQNCYKIGVDQCLFLFAIASLITQPFFLSKIKDIIIHFLYKINNDIIQRCVFRLRILPLLSIITPNVKIHYSILLD